MKPLFRLTLLCAITCAMLTADLSAADVTIVPTPQSKTFPIVDKHRQTATFVVDPSDAEVVTTAAEAVAGDIALITGETPAIAASLAGVKFPIIAGTIGSSPLIDELAAKGKIDVADVKGKWEAYGLAVVEKPFKGVKRALVAFGSNPRATAYSLFEISKLMGVSPYVWWADVIPEKRDQLYATSGATTIGEPSVKWRGIFINDEDWGLMPWAAKNIDSEYNNIGPNTYAKVMELLLRLRANVLWPAMHLCSQAFWDNKDNLPVAKKYDIALGSSHCEQMLRDNEWEWRRYEDKTGTYDNWNYVDNKEKIQRYWEDRVKESKGFSAMYTLGMRGVHDWGISGYPTTEDKVRGLTEIIDYQRSLLDKHIGDPTTVPQIFIPYKEVLDAYNAGLQVPDDVILTWVDDNHGYIRQLPTPEEQKRRGGHGVYYHLSYWGTPADYLWLCSTSPSLISYELVKGYENGIKDLWVINVGDIKPAEAELEFCMDLAWDVDAWRPEKAHEYNRHWMRKTFGEETADELAEIRKEYYELGAAGKPEHIFNVTFTDGEMNDRIDRYALLSEKTDEIAHRIPARLRDAYFELVEYLVKGAYNMNVMTFRAKQSLDLAKQGNKAKALAYAAEAEKAYNEIARLTDKYNKGIANGKWDGMMDSKPRRLSQFELPPRATADFKGSVEYHKSEKVNARQQAAGYKASRGEITEMPGLGTGEGSVAVWPMDYTDYSDGRIGDAPYVEYLIPVSKGENKIEVRFVPSFPVHSGENLNVALSIDGGEPRTYSLKTVATEGKWNHTVLQGYNDATAIYTSPANGQIKLRVSFLNPGIALSEIVVKSEEKPDSEALAAEIMANIADPANGDLLLADPTIFLLDGKYYMAGTQNGNPGFNVLQSDDLLLWQPTSADMLPQLEPGYSIYGTKWFWAPQFLPMNDRVYLFYTANEHVACAASDEITGKYAALPDVVSGNFTGIPQPIDGSCGNIDPFLFLDDDGKCYLYHVRFDNGNYIWVGEFDMEKGKIVDGTLQPTFRVDQPWEHTHSYESVPIMEGPTMVKIDGTYYLFYSANHYMSKDYAVGYATAPTPLGPWTKNPANPIISREIVGESGSGHGDVFLDKEGGLRYVFHTHNSEDKVGPRRTRIISLKKEKPAIKGAPARIVADRNSLLKPKIASANCLPTAGTR